MAGEMAAGARPLDYRMVLGSVNSNQCKTIPSELPERVGSSEITSYLHSYRVYCFKIQLLCIVRVLTSRQNAIKTFSHPIQLDLALLWA